MPGSHGAADRSWTTSGPDFTPSESRRTRYPKPGLTSRNSTPPSAVAFCVYRTFPRGVRSDTRALGASPVAYTCSTLPAALKAGVDAAAPASALTRIKKIAAARDERFSAEFLARVRFDISPPRSEERRVGKECRCRW